MKALAAFIMRGRMQATIVASVLVVLALLLTPLGVVSAAVVGLVALRQGVREASLVMLMGALALALLGLLLFGQPMALALTGILLWLPLVILGEVLRITRSLRLAVELAVLGGFLLVGLQYLLLGDVAAFWQETLGQYLGQFMNPELVSEQERLEMAAAIAPWMAGGLGAAWFLQLVVSLFLARGWQAALYHPGGFGEEFYQLRLGGWLLILVPVLLVAGMLAGTPALFSQLGLVGMSAFFVQGVSVVHALTSRNKSGQYWLIGFYFLLIIGMPASFTAVSAAGYADGWLNIRARVRPRKNDSGDE